MSGKTLSSRTYAAVHGGAGLKAREQAMINQFTKAFPALPPGPEHSRRRQVLATTDTQIWFNSDIPTGDYRRINLQRPPYRFPAPVRVIRDDAVAAGRVLALWKTSELGLRP